ncbi:hypothetical protein [Flexivirga oryzae]|uniref:Uncharacterized protein n=1 Tax=Flexivirga oryzae TaxID=1794944 RepID=A0A839N4G0_9MICO|nr:hypothetical protein [Flexivirga oryzae]MBB2892197.1 hypothetical protein [Flexivirga oryzae]
MSEAQCPCWCTLDHRNPLLDPHAHEGDVQHGVLVDAWIYADPDDDRDPGTRFGLDIIGSWFTIPGDVRLLDLIVRELTAARERLAQCERQGSLTENE